MVRMITLIAAQDITDRSPLAEGVYPYIVSPNGILIGWAYASVKAGQPVPVAKEGLVRVPAETGNYIEGAVISYRLSDGFIIADSSRPIGIAAENKSVVVDGEFLLINAGNY